MAAAREPKVITIEVNKLAEMLTTVKILELLAIRLVYDEKALGKQMIADKKLTENLLGEFVSEQLDQRIDDIQIELNTEIFAAILEEFPNNKENR